jgi:hypothetical protein
MPERDLGGLAAGAPSHTSASSPCLYLTRRILSLLVGCTDSWITCAKNHFSMSDVLSSLASCSIRR